MNIKLYRSRVPVQAIRYSPVTADEAIQFICDNARCARKLHYLEGERAPRVWVNAHQAWAHLEVGSIVVADDVGVQVLDPDQFAERYEDMPVPGGD